MSATAEQVARLRRLCALAADDPAWTDEVLAEIIERYPLVDVHDGTTRYDMPAAIAEVWSAKAAALFPFVPAGGQPLVSLATEFQACLCRLYGRPAIPGAGR